jgi:hypothetical protein
VSNPRVHEADHSENNNKHAEKRMKATLIVIGLAAIVMAAPSHSSPLGAAKSLKIDTPAASQPVHWRGYRHCHWRMGDRWCHGRRYYRSGPGINLYIGPSRRGWRHRGRHW